MYISPSVSCAERGDLQSGRQRRARGERQRRRGIARDIPEIAAAEITEHVAAVQRGNRAAAIHETAGRRLAQRAAVLRDRRDRARGVGPAGRS